MLLGVAFLLPILFHFQNLWRSAHYQFFPILLISIVVILSDRGVRFKDLPRSMPILDWPYSLLTVGGLFLLMVAIIVDTPNAAMIAFLIFTAGIVWRLSVVEKISLWGPWALGWLLVQLPGFVERSLTNSLQLLSSRLSSRLLDWAGINHLLTGNIMRLETRDLFVDEACSGVVSLFSILSFGAMYAVWKRYTLLHACLLLMLGVGFTVLLNVLRITTIAVADQWFDLNLADGVPHTLLGLVLFAVTLAGFYCSDQVLGQFLLPIPKPTAGSRRLNVLERIWNWSTTAPKSKLDVAPAGQTEKPPQSGPSKLANGLVVLFSVVIISLWGGRQFVLANLDFVDSQSKTVVANINESFLEKMGIANGKYEDVERARNDPDGSFSKSILDNSKRNLSYSIDYPFFGRWHELTNCYEVSGWEINRRAVVDDADGDFVEVNLSNPQGENGYLLFSFVDTDGLHVDSSDTSDLLGWAFLELKRRISHGLTNEVIQLQLWHPSVLELDDREKEELKRNFLKFRKTAIAEMFPDMPSSQN